MSFLVLYILWLDHSHWPVQSFLSLIHNGIDAEVQFAEAGLCKIRSQTLSGPCTITGHSDNQCKTVEGAVQGARPFAGGWACFCFFDC